MGICDIHPLTSERLIPMEHPGLKEECTFRETLDIVKRLGAKRTYLTHIEEVDGLSFTDLMEVKQSLDVL